MRENVHSSFLPLTDLCIELFVSSNERGAGDDFVANLFQGVEKIVGLGAELDPPMSLVSIV